jgi:hypothetical protein
LDGRHTASYSIFTWGGHTIFGTTATVRDIMAYAEETNIPTCLLTIDFKEDFDNIIYLPVLYTEGIQD